MEFTVLERILLLGLFPKEMNYVTLKVVRNLEEILSFSEEEILDYGIVVNDINCTWDASKAKDKRIDVGITGLEIIRKELKKLDDENKLTKDHYSLCEKFLG